MSFKKFIPQKPLNEFIDSIVQIDIKSGLLDSTKTLFIPNGHSALVIHLSNSVCITHNGTNVLLPNMFFTGILNTHVHLVPTGDLCSIFVLFKPDALYHLFKIDMEELNRIQYTQIDNIIGHTAYVLYEQLLFAETINERIKLIECFFNNYTNQIDITGNSIKFIYNKIIMEKGCTRVADLSEYFNIPTRSLHRKFTTQTGLTPKEFARMIRFKSIVHYLHAPQKLDWAEIVNVVDLTDQSHLINEIKRFTGYSPQKFMALNQDVLSILNGTIK